MAKLKELIKNEEGLTGGHRLCAGCGASIIMRQVLLTTKNPVVIGIATGCLEVSTTIYPYTAWRVPFIHNAFENSAATISGVETAYRAFKKRGKIKQEMNFIAIGGDGGTYDIGIQSLSGALERGHRLLYICYDNGAYMNTGIQRSSATPIYAWTTTSPVGKVKPGKLQRRKDLTAIVADHEIEDGQWKLNYKPRKKRSIIDWLKPQGRFKHLFKEQNKEYLETIQEQIDSDWAQLLKRCGEEE